MSPSFLQGANPRLDDVRGSIKIWLANFEVDDFLALLFQRAGAIENFESGFRPEPRHPAGQAQIVGRCSGHRDA